MSLIEKSEQNINAAKILINNKFFSTSVHASYYACFQLIILINEKYPSNQIKIDNNEKQGTHEKRINLLKILIDTKIQDTKQRKKIIQDLFQIKKVRKTADYENTLIQQDTAQHVLQQSITLTKSLKKLLYETIH
ncbi:MAG: hypothetical protein N2203_07225 [Bacteroidia bacterium]|nr:hypothetical protein [Bacteroidia bacterium]